METWMRGLGAAGAIATIGMGLMGLLAPKVASRLTGLEAGSKAAFAEFRGTFGGMFVALGALPLALGTPAAYAVSAWAWWGASLGRIVSIAVDGGHREPKNLAGAVGEAVIGGLLFAGSLAT